MTRKATKNIFHFHASLYLLFLNLRLPIYFHHITKWTPIRMHPGTPLPCSTYSCAGSIKRPPVTVRCTHYGHIGRLTLSTSFDPPQQYTLKSTLSQHARRKPLGASCQQMSECSEHLRLSSTLKSSWNTFIY